MTRFAFLFCFFCCCLPLLCCCAAAEDHILIYEDDCKKLIDVKPPKKREAHLLKSGVSKSVLEKIKNPRRWILDWWSFGPESFCGGEETFTVSASAKKPLDIFGPMVVPDNSRYYTVELTLKMPSKSSYSHSKIEVGILRYGFYEPPLKVITHEEFCPGEEKTICAQIELSDDFCNFRPLFRASGELEFKKLTVKKKHDDLVAAGMTVVEGILKECSQIPDPKKSDYPDCRFVCRFVGNSIIAGKPLPREIAVVLEGFEKYKYKNTRQLKAGDKVRMLLIPFQDLPEKKKTTQQADDLNLFLLDNYYVCGLLKVRDFVDSWLIASSGVPFSTKNEEYVSVFKRQLNPPISKACQQARDAAVKNDLRILDELLKPYDKGRIAELNREFKAVWQKEYQKDFNGRNRIGNLVWRNINNSFWSLPKNHQFVAKQGHYIPQRNMDSLIAFNKFLKANGTHLIIVPTPHLFDISARVMNKKFKDVPDIKNATVVRQLLQNDIEAVYASGEIIRNFDRYPFAFFYPNNGHPSDTVQDVISDILAEKLQRYMVAGNLDPAGFTVELHPHVYENEKRYCFPENCDIGNNIPGTPYKCRKVLYNGQDASYDKNASIFMFGSSFMQTPMSYPDSLPTLLSMKLCTGVSASRMDASGPLTQIIPAIFYAPEDYVAGKKVIIMCVSCASLTNENLDMPDVSLMDDNALLLVGKTQVAVYEIKGVKPSENMGKYTVISGKSGKTLLIDGEAARWDVGKEAVLVLAVSHADIRNKAVCKINGAVKNIPHSHTVRSVPVPLVFKIPSGVRELTVELESVPGAAISVSNIQIYQ